MTIDARTAPPEPSLHAAALLSRTRLTQLECAARLGISERTLRYHLTGRPMSYALRCLFERLARECEFIQLAATVNREPLRDYQEKILGWLHNQFLGRVNREGRVTEQTIMQGTAPSKKRVTVADLLNPSALSPFLTTPTDGGTEYLPEVGPPCRFLRDALEAIGPCRLEIRDLTCAEAANPWARNVAAYNAALYGTDFAKVEARARAHAESQPRYRCPACNAGSDYRTEACDTCGYSDKYESSP